MVSNKRMCSVKQYAFQLV